MKLDLVINPFNIFLVIIGWWYVRYNGHYFANRSELKSTIKDTQTLLKELEELARRYWESELPEGVARTKDCIDVMIGLTRLEHHLKQLNQRKLDIDSSGMVRQLRIKLTGDHFAQKDKPILQADDPKMLVISTEINKIYSLLDTKFEEKFSALLPSFSGWLKRKLLSHQPAERKEPYL